MRHIKPAGLFPMFAALACVTVFLALIMPGPAHSQMMHSGSMNGMREMMQRMMGDVLPPGMDPALLPEPKLDGARLLTGYCAQCHNLPGPGMHTAAEWPQVVRRMYGRMQMMSGGMMGGGMMDVSAPSTPELNTLIEYLQKHAQKPMDITQYPDLNAPTGKVFHAVCTQCHALPDPKQHTVIEWPAVVARMKKNMSIMGKDVPDEITTKAITGFLQRHAREPK